MIFHVRDLEIRAARFDVELPPGGVEFLDPKLRQAGPLKASGKIELVLGTAGEIKVKGHVNVRVDVDCDRCLEPARFPIDEDFELYYSPMTNEPGEERAIDTEETETGFYNGDSLDLDDVLREYVLLALPMQRVCSENCKGICPKCGQNRNQIECQCQTAAEDARWAALKELKRV